MSTIGMMDGAFFVGRKEILDWINSTLDLNLGKIEDTANGAIACQLLDIMYPGQVPMHKINWQAKQDFEFVGNYKVLQTCFQKLNIERHVDVDRLITGRYMDNLEFMQWFKKFFEMTVSEKGDYDAYARRSLGKGGAQFNNASKKNVLPSSKPSSAPVASKSSAGSSLAKPPASTGSSTNTGSNSRSNNKPPAAPTISANSSSHSLTSGIANNQENQPGNTNTVTSLNSITSQSPVEKPNHIHHHSSSFNHHHNNEKDVEILHLRQALEESRRAFSELKVELDGTTKEREFYFEKLRDIEILLQEVEEKSQGNDLTAAIFKILYATADGFEVIAEDGIAAGGALNGLDTNPSAENLSVVGEAKDETY